MRLDVYVHNVLDPDTAHAHKKIIGKLNLLIQNEEMTSMALSDIAASAEAAAAAIASVEDTVEAKFAALRALILELSANQNDPAAEARIQAAVDAIMGKAGEFASDAADPEPAPEA